MVSPCGLISAGYSETRATEKNRRGRSHLCAIVRPTAISKILKRGWRERPPAPVSGKCGSARVVSSDRADNLQAALEPRRRDGICTWSLYTRVNTDVASNHVAGALARAVSAVATFWRTNKSTEHLRPQRTAVAGGAN